MNLYWIAISLKFSLARANFMEIKFTLCPDSMINFHWIFNIYWRFKKAQKKFNPYQVSSPAFIPNKYLCLKRRSWLFWCGFWFFILFQFSQKKLSLCLKYKQVTGIMAFRPIFFYLLFWSPNQEHSSQKKRLCILWGFSILSVQIFNISSNLHWIKFHW